MTRLCLMITLAALACRHAPLPSAQRVEPGVQQAVLAAVAESVWAVATSRGVKRAAVLAPDSVTIRVLAALGQRAGIGVVQAPPRVWCSGAAGAEHTVGTVARLTIDSLAANRAIVRWSVTCLLPSPSEAEPALGGELGAFEVVRRGRLWQIARSLYRLEL
jgi:hypothetical protein